MLVSNGPSNAPRDRLGGFLTLLFLDDLRFDFFGNFFFLLSEDEDDGSLIASVYK